MKLSTRQIVISGILGAVSIVLGITGLGFIPVPTPAANATIMHIPVILGAVIEGPVVGLAAGLIFGIFSFLRAGTPFFADPLIAIFPRLLISITSYFTFTILKRFNRDFASGTAGVIGSLTNTIFVLGLAVLRGFLPFGAGAATAAVHGPPEAVIAAVLLVILVRVIDYTKPESNNSNIQ